MSQQVRTHQEDFPKAACPRTKDGLIHLYSGKSCLNTKVSFVTRRDGDILAHAQLEDEALHPTIENSRKSPPLEETLVL